MRQRHVGGSKIAEADAEVRRSPSLHVACRHSWVGQEETRSPKAELFRQPSEASRPKSRPKRAVRSTWHLIPLAPHSPGSTSFPWHLIPLGAPHSPGSGPKRAVRSTWHLIPPGTSFPPGTCTSFPPGTSFPPPGSEESRPKRAVRSTWHLIPLHLIPLGPKYMAPHSPPHLIPPLMAPHSPLHRRTSFPHSPLHRRTSFPVPGSIFIGRHLYRAAEPRHFKDRRPL